MCVVCGFIYDEAEGLPEDLFERLVLQPHQQLVRRVRELGVIVPLIGFPRGSAALAERYLARIGGADPHPEPGPAPFLPIEQEIDA